MKVGVHCAVARTAKFANPTGAEECEMCGEKKKTELK